MLPRFLPPLASYSPVHPPFPLLLLSHRRRDRPGSLSLLRPSPCRAPDEDEAAPVDQSIGSRRRLGSLLDRFGFLSHRGPVAVLAAASSCLPRGSIDRVELEMMMRDR